MVDQPGSESSSSLKLAENEEPSPAVPGSGTESSRGTGGVESTVVGGQSGSRPRSRGRWRLEIAIAVVIVVGTIVATYVVVEMDHKSPSSSGGGGTVLVPAGTLWALPADEPNAILFSQNSSVSVEGTITNAGGAQVYIMTPGQYFTFVTTYNITGYEWTSGPIATGTYYNLAVTIPAGGWDLVFASSVPDTATAIGIYSNLVENP